MKRVVLYSSSHCPHCERAIEFLKQHQVTYRLCNVKTPAGQKELARAGFRTVPVLKVSDQYVVGFNAKNWTSIINE